jgi:hypothetical protein
MMHGDAPNGILEKRALPAVEILLFEKRKIKIRDTSKLSRSHSRVSVAPIFQMMGTERRTSAMGRSAGESSRNRRACAAIYAVGRAEGQAFFPSLHKF